MNDQELLKVIDTCSRCSFKIFGKEFLFRVERDNLDPVTGRIFIQVTYMDKCRKTGEEKAWHGRKWYLSQYMTTDEIIKTAFAACKAAVEHETLEAFKVGGTILFNPHVEYTHLLAISPLEISRND